MDEEKTIVERLITVQKELKAPKNQFNNFGKYKYRSAEDILEAVKPLNAMNNLLLTISDEPVLVGNRQYIKATATITDGKETIYVDAYARESENRKGQDDSQITGTASSYARKYALNGLYLIDDTKDADTDEYRNQNNVKQNNAPQNQQKPPRKANDKEMQLLHEKANELAMKYQMDPVEMKQKMGFKDNMNEAEYKQMLTRVNDGLNKAG